VRTGKVNHWPSTPCPASPTDPLAELRKAAGKDALKGSARCGDERLHGRHPLERRWPQAAVMLRANDNKDRWIASVDADDDAGLQPATA
jgi:hypothetical protein